VGTVAIIFGIYGSIGLLVIIPLVYVLVKRLKARKTEDFEKRDN